MALYWKTKFEDVGQRSWNVVAAKLFGPIDSKYCISCSYPLTPSAFDEIKVQEDSKFRSLEARFNGLQSKFENLIAGLERIKDQKTLTAVSRSLFSSGLLQVAER